MQGFDLNKMRYIFFPVHCPNYWMLVVYFLRYIIITSASSARMLVVFVQQQIICVVDSLTRQNSQHAEAVNWIWYRNSA